MAVDLLTEETPWRVFLVTAPPVYGSATNATADRRYRNTGPSRLPTADWREAGFDDSTWGRYSADLTDMIGGYGFRLSEWLALFCMRTRFGIADPEHVKALGLELTFRGGAVVHVNGIEVGRSHMPKADIAPMTLACDYPREAYMMPDGRTQLPRTDRPAKEHTERYERRVRSFSVDIPASALRRGANVLAVELHRTAMRSRGWSSVGFYGLRLTSESGAGVVPYPEAIGKVSVWNASPLDTIVPTVEGKLPYRSTWNVGAHAVSPEGIAGANPFDPLVPVRMAAPRGGVCSGQVVVSAPTQLSGVRAEIGPLEHSSGTALPETALDIRYAVKQAYGRYCDTLAREPGTGSAVQPVWIIAEIPRDQRPGWYSGALTVSAGKHRFVAPVQVLVSGWTCPGPTAYRSFGNILQSPDSLAMQYGVAPLSDGHFDLIGQSLSMLGKLGNDVLLVPVIHDTHLGHRTGFVRWVRNGGNHEPEFSAMERLIDLHIRHCGKPKVIVLNVWKPQYGSRAKFRGAQIKDLESILVTLLDAGTRAMSGFEAPMFGSEGSEEFWGKMIAGAGRVVAARGLDERCLVLGQAFDSRPVEGVVEFFSKIAPGMRWDVFSHYVGDPPPRDGKLEVSGLPVGFREVVGRHTLPALGAEYPDVPTTDYVSCGANRIDVLTWSSPTSYRNLPNLTGTFGRIGLDFWRVTSRRGRPASVFNSGYCGYWLYKSNPVEIAAPGPKGPLPTARYQMLREGVQDVEARIAIAMSLHKLPEGERDRFQRILRGHSAARAIGAIMSQAQLSLDWLGLASRTYDAAAELAGEKCEGSWDDPPDPHE